MAINSDQSVEDLLSEGRYGDAAAAARAAGDPGRAADLYERIWDFSRAADCAREAGDLARALKNAIDAREEPLVGELRAALVATGDEGRASAVEVFSRKRRFGDAAVLAEELGDKERAIELYKGAHRDLDAARLLADAGRDREAGRLLERAIEHGGPGPTIAEAHLHLGVILARRMQHEESARHLQEAARHADTRLRALRMLVLELAALGLRDAARDALIEAREKDASLPVDLEEFLRRERPAAVRRREEEEEGAQIVAGRYRLEELIGSGGSGRVYRAHDEVSGRAVALKMFHTAYARGTPALERFVREARIASALHHPNLVEVYAFSAELGFLVMELLPGDSLRDRLSAPLAGAAVRRMCLDVLAGLELAHQRGIIHRDVKPANIFFDARGTAKLGDFGVAHLLDLGQTQTGGLIGTLAYMPPEQITGAPLTIAADLYALGVTLFEALTGRLPFLGPDFVAQHLGETPPTPTRIAPNVAADWDPIIARLLSKDPSRRYESVDALRREVSAVDLGEEARPRPLAIPRAARPSRPPGEEPAEEEPTAPESPDPARDEPRYRFESTIGYTPVSTLSRALDRALDRSVILERYLQGAFDEAAERRLYALARSSGPFLQRVLAYDRNEQVAVFEAPSGRPLSEAAAGAPLPPRRAIRLIQRLARAVSALHEVGGAHGHIEGSTVLVDDVWIPTILVCGLGSADREATPERDVTAIFALVADRLGCEASAEGVLEALAPGLSHPEKVAFLASGEPRNGAELFAFADAVEIAMLKAAWRDRTGPGEGAEESVP